jgi:spermidine/putrescine-binding protein
VPNNQEKAMKLSRRTVMGGMVGGAATLAFPSVLRAQSRELVMIGYGNEQDQPLTRAGEELSRRYPGVTLTIIGGLSTEAMAQIKAARGNSPYDMAVMGSPAIINALDEDVLEPLDLSLIPNSANIDERFIPYGYETGCPITFEGIGIAYNTEAIQTPPTTWAELWNPEYAGRIGMARPQSNLGLGVLAATNAAFDRPQDYMEFALSKWQELDPLVGRSPPLLQQMLERGEIDIAPLWHVNTALAAAAGLPVAYAKVAGPGPLMLPSNVVHFINTADGTRELVHEFADIMLEQQSQAMAGGAPYYFGTVVKGMEVAVEARPFVPSTEEEIASMTSLDWPTIAPMRGTTVENFDRMFAG